MFWIFGRRQNDARSKHTFPHLVFNGEVLNHLGTVSKCSSLAFIIKKNMKPEIHIEKLVLGMVSNQVLYLFNLANNSFKSITSQGIQFAKDIFLYNQW